MGSSVRRAFHCRATPGNTGDSRALAGPCAQGGADEHGKVVYNRWCASCHGETGAGDGDGARFMLPRPRDFTAGAFQIRTTKSGQIPTDEDLMHIVDEGMPGTAMPGWRADLSAQDRADVVAYIKTFSRRFRVAPAERADVCERAQPQRRTPSRTARRSFRSCNA